MSFLKRLLGGRSSAERLTRGEQLLREGEAGLARLELEAAAAAADLDAAQRARASRLLEQATAEIRQARLEEARIYAEAGEGAAARQSLELAAALGASEAELEAVGGLLRQAPAVAPEVLPEGQEAEPEDAPGPADEEPSGEVDPAGLSPLDLALLGFSEAEADELRSRVAVEPRLGEALGAAADGDWAGALAAHGKIPAPVADEPLVRRERARALLAAGQAGEAAERLAAVRQQLPADPDTLELLMEARLALGDLAGAAELATRVLDLGQPRDVAALVKVMLDAGQGEAALERVDRLLDRNRREGLLWQVRAALCERLGSPEGALEADARVLEIYAQDCSSCGGREPIFPLASARRLAEAWAATARSAAERSRTGDLLTMLIRHDPEQRARWEALRAESRP